MIRFGKLTTAVLGISMMLGAAAPAFARPYNPCVKRIRTAENNLRKAIRKHGPNSRQAAERRQQVERVRANCRM